MKQSTDSLSILAVDRFQLPISDCDTFPPGHIKLVTRLLLITLFGETVDSILLTLASIELLSITIPYSICDILIAGHMKLVVHELLTIIFDETFDSISFTLASSESG